jgi:hypothetical protein
MRPAPSLYIFFYKNTQPYMTQCTLQNTLRSTDFLKCFGYDDKDDNKNWNYITNKPTRQK